MAWPSSPGLIYNTFALTAIAYLQPVTQGEISKLAGREISRDIIAALKRHGLVDGTIRTPQPGAPFAYVTTKQFSEAFGFESPRDPPDLERLKAEDSLLRGQGAVNLYSTLGWRMRATTTGTCPRATVKSSTQPIASEPALRPLRSDPAQN
jgi:Segregation and condensation complex subunit ScpB